MIVLPNRHPKATRHLALARLLLPRVLQLKPESRMALQLRLAGARERVLPSLPVPAPEWVAGLGLAQWEGCYWRMVGSGRQMELQTRQEGPMRGFGLPVTRTRKPMAVKPESG